MKRFSIVTVLLLFFALSFTECKRELELTPLGELTEATFYQTESDFEAASLSPYATMLTFYFDQFGSGWYQPMLWPDDDVTVRSGGSDQIEDFNWLPGNGSFTSVKFTTW
jgi:hypothetical protein